MYNFMKTYDQFYVVVYQNLQFLQVFNHLMIIVQRIVSLSVSALLKIVCTQHLWDCELITVHHIFIIALFKISKIHLLYFT